MTMTIVARLRTWRDQLRRRPQAAGLDRRQMDNYVDLLRRAVIAGWEAAKADYHMQQWDLGRSTKEIQDEIAFFERLNAADRARGLDPIVAQKLRDVQDYLATPIAVMGGIFATGIAADYGLNSVRAVGIGLLAVFVGRKIVLLTLLAIRH
jgi:hypothetical protein